MMDRKCGEDRKMRKRQRKNGYRRMTLGVGKVAVRLDEWNLASAEERSADFGKMKVKGEI
jgi:hypothetical protein